MKDRWHFAISTVKSILRISGCFFYISNGEIDYFVTAFLLAEVLGIVEELMDKRG